MRITCSPRILMKTSATESTSRNQRDNLTEARESTAERNVNQTPRHYYRGVRRQPAPDRRRDNEDNGLSMLAEGQEQYSTLQRQAFSRTCNV